MYNNRVVVYTSGTFDMFHSNHLKMIEYAKGLGDTLIVGVSTDDLVASYKKPPIIPFEERLAIIKALKFPDIVIPQHTLDHTEIVKKLNIDVFVVGDDWVGKYDYLKVPNFGLVNNNTADFIKTVSPKIASISCSDKNPADQATLDALQEAGTTVYLTKNGNVKLTSDGKTVEVKQ